MIFLDEFTENRSVRKNEVDTIVIHAMGEKIKYKNKDMEAKDFLNEIKLSAHFLICPDGEVIRCAEPEDFCCWHARGHNASSIGIEILVEGVHNYSSFVKRIDEENWYTTSQINILTELCLDLMWQFDIGIEGVKGHCEIDPSRKRDPGKGFSMDDFRNDLFNALARK